MADEGWRVPSGSRRYMHMPASQREGRCPDKEWYQRKRHKNTEDWKHSRHGEAWISGCGSWWRIPEGWVGASRSWVSKPCPGVSHHPGDVVRSPFLIQTCLYCDSPFNDFFKVSFMCTWWVFVYVNTSKHTPQSLCRGQSQTLVHLSPVLGTNSSIAHPWVYEGIWFMNSMDSPIPAFHPATGAVGLWMHTNVHGFTCVLRIWLRSSYLAKQTFYLRATSQAHPSVFWSPSAYRWASSTLLIITGKETYLQLV